MFSHIVFYQKSITLATFCFTTKTGIEFLRYPSQISLLYTHVCCDVRLIYTVDVYPQINRIKNCFCKNSFCVALKNDSV